MPVNGSGTNSGVAQTPAELGVEHHDRIGLFPPPDDGGHALENLLTFPFVDEPRGGGEPAQRPLRFTLRQLFYEVTDVTHAGWMTKLHAMKNGRKIARGTPRVDGLHTPTADRDAPSNSPCATTSRMRFARSVAREDSPSWRSRS